MPRSSRFGIRPLLDRVEYDTNGGCWLWSGALNNKGYGMVRRFQKNTTVHRKSWEEERGPIPKGMCVLHRCDTPSCFNPNHLFIGTKADNTDDMVKKGRNQPCRGEASGRAIVTEDIVRAIRADTRHPVVAGESYGISERAIRSIRKRERWAHVA